MKIVRFNVNDQGDEETILIAEHVDKEWAEPAIKLWNKKEQKEEFPLPLTLVENDDTSVYGYGFNLSKITSVDKDGKELDKGTGAVIDDTSVATELVYFWNKHNWMVDSDVFYKIMFSMESSKKFHGRFKVITKSNYNEELYVECVVAENLEQHWGEQLVKQWNEKYWTEHSNEFLELVEQTYVPYDGYKENGYY